MFVKQNGSTPHVCHVDRVHPNLNVHQTVRSVVFLTYVQIVRMM